MELFAQLFSFRNSKFYNLKILGSSVPGTENMTLFESYLFYFSMILSSVCD